MSDRGDPPSPEDPRRTHLPADPAHQVDRGSEGQDESEEGTRPGRLREGGNTQPSGRLDVPSLATLLLPLPWYVWSVGVVYWLGTLVVDAPWARTLLGVWLLCGAVMLWRRFEAAIARVTFQLRHPIRSESEKLSPAWAAVTRSANIDGARYTLLIEESGDVNASGSGGRVVAVTRKSLELPAPQLAAVLAHELGHQVDGYNSVRAVGLWYSLPARAATWLIRNFGRIMRAAPAVGCLISAFVSLSLLGIVLTALIFDYVPLALFGIVLIFLAPLVLAWFDRLGEKNADKVAADRGYGPALLEVLSDLHAKNHDAERRASGRGASVLSSQPSVADRIRSLEKYLSQKSG